MHESHKQEMSPTPSGPDVHLSIAIDGVVPPSRFALFRRRVNRFVVEIELIDDEPDTSPVRIVTKLPTTASMSNPGRMQEILLPGARLGLVPGPEDGRHPWRVVSFHRDDLTIPIDTVTANRVARFLIRSQRIPALRDWDIAQSEVARRGGSRFDFLLRRRDSTADRAVAGEERYLEVKSCSLFNGPWAFFPDAVTTRGRRHVEELADLGGGAVLFVVNSGEAKYFSPDFHADIAFARTLARSRRSLEIIAVGVGWTQDLRIAGPVRELAIPWDGVEAQLDDAGSYLVLLRLSKPRTIEVGALGSREFAPGYYLYVGSAMKNLSGRIEHHRRGGAKHLHWHIDYLRRIAAYADSWAIREPYRREPEIAEAVAALAESDVPGFGASDSAARSHLFFWRDDPRRLPQFQALILALRRFGLDRHGAP